MNMVCTHALVNSSHNHRTFIIYFLILENLINEVNIKESISSSSWKLEADKNTRQKLEVWGWEWGWAMVVGLGEWKGNIEW